MSDTTKRYTHLISTGMLTLMMLGSASFCVLKHETVAQEFIKLGYPTYVIYPLALAKGLGVLAIWVKKPRMLMEWAYAGFFFDFLLAASAHIMIADGEFVSPLVALFILFTSYFSRSMN